MDGCSLSDAFPDAVRSTDYGNKKGGDAARRYEKKKARRCRDQNIQSLGTEPDRPIESYLEAVLPVNSKTGLTEHSPATAQYPYEGFVDQIGSQTDLQTIMNNVQHPSRPRADIPPVSSSSTSLLSAYFGSSPNDPSPVMSVRPSGNEGFTSEASPYVNVIGDDSSYKLYPDFSKTFAQRGAAKAQGVGSADGPLQDEYNFMTPAEQASSAILPVPNVSTFWKTQHPTGGQSAYFNSLQPPGGLPSLPNIPSSMIPSDTRDISMQQKGPEGRRDVLEKLDRIFARLDDMEANKNENANTEVLMFLFTGLGIIFLMDISCRVATSK